jgi:tRNA (cmo5U34)-methyltransferase
MSTHFFDANAANWDIPMRVERAQAIATALLREAAPAHNARVADYGTGTGLLAVALAPHVGEVIALDNSARMLAVLEEKCQASAIPNIHGRRFDIEQDEIDPALCDIFVSSMVLHHLRSPAQYARAAWRALCPGGLSVVIDLDSEAGEFHQDHADVHHHGFERAALDQVFIASGFEPARFSTVFTLRKPGRSGPEREFSLFMMIARKP